VAQKGGLPRLFRINHVLSERARVKPARVLARKDSSTQKNRLKDSDFEPRSVLRYLAESALKNFERIATLVSRKSRSAARHAAEGQRQETVLLVSAVEVRILSA
jgi:hypothetical protein